MASIRRCTLPTEALLGQYAAGPAANKNHTDCYSVKVNGHYDIEQFVFSFLTTWLFRLERILIRWFAGRRSTDAQARDIAQGGDRQFAVWNVEGQSSTQRLLRDASGATRSWFMVEPGREAKETTLYFGSAIVALPNPGHGQLEISRGFRLLMPVHQLYSRALLYAAKRRLGHQGSI